MEFVLFFARDFFGMLFYRMHGLYLSLANNPKNIYLGGANACITTKTAYKYYNKYYN